ncbi:hypothetical protein PVL29_013413 [Vitis rotundifolia]|uniref:Cytochrome P450 n=1 Tax=Vitis rotundifolia TaxID=103349 RepID=A0AA39DNJ0_VITRO|nr:hypothetical protein PVL29_013413 [Vitis rotundifolia]
MAEEVMKTHDREFSSRPSLLALIWEIRKICVLHLFSSKRAQSFRPILENEVLGMIKKISKSVSASKLTNLSEILPSLTNAIICRVAFGKSYDDEGCERSRFHRLLAEFQTSLGGFYFSDYFPLMGWVDKLSGMTSQLEKIFKESDSFDQEIIDEHLHPSSPKPEQEIL